MDERIQHTGEAGKQEIVETPLGLIIAGTVPKKTYVHKGLSHGEDAWGCREIKNGGARIVLVDEPSPLPGVDLSRGNPNGQYARDFVVALLSEGSVNERVESGLTEYEKNGLDTLSPGRGNHLPAFASVDIYPTTSGIYTLQFASSRDCSIVAITPDISAHNRSTALPLHMNFQHLGRKIDTTYLQHGQLVTSELQFQADTGTIILVFSDGALQHFAASQLFERSEKIFPPRDVLLKLADTLAYDIEGLLKGWSEDFDRLDELKKTEILSAFLRKYEFRQNTDLTPRQAHLLSVEYANFSRLLKPLMQLMQTMDKEEVLKLLISSLTSSTESWDDATVVGMVLN